MKNRFAVALAGALMLAALVPASAASHINERDHIRHVLLISVDGLHALDVANFRAIPTPHWPSYRAMASPIPMRARHHSRILSPAFLRS